jgi:NAD(P) transhydrogenase subunit beta
MSASILINASYFIVAVLFILGLKSMSSPVTARRGILWAGAGMVLATLVTFGWPGMHNYTLMVVALALGGGAAWWSGTVVKMTDMPQMVAIYNGMGGGAAAAIAAVKFAEGEVHGTVVTALAVLGTVMGTVSFSGSCIAFAKLQGIMKKAFRLPAHNVVNVILNACTFFVSIAIVTSAYPTPILIVALFVLSLMLGIIITMPIGGADMPVMISLFNATTGLAVGFEGFVLANPALIIAGIVVGSAGTLLTQRMAKAMNRSLTNILFNPITGEAQTSGEGSGGTMKEATALDAAAMMHYARKVIIVPGYGMAVAQAQHKVWEMAKLLEEMGVEVKFAIHPVAGRMPGHMNVLLVEAGVPYEKIFDLDEINAEFPQTDVALVIGANDVVNPVARTDKSSPIYGMPILDADKAQNVIVIKRGKGAGYSGIENALFYAENTRMLYGSAQQAVSSVIQRIKEMAL